MNELSIIPDGLFLGACAYLTKFEHNQNGEWIGARATEIVSYMFRDTAKIQTYILAVKNGATKKDLSEIFEKELIIEYKKCLLKRILNEISCNDEAFTE